MTDKRDPGEFERQRTPNINVQNGSHLPGPKYLQAIFDGTSNKMYDTTAFMA